MPDARCLEWEWGLPDGLGSSPSSLWPCGQDSAQGAELTPQTPPKVALRPLPRWWGPRTTPGKTERGGGGGVTAAEPRTPSAPRPQTQLPANTSSWSQQSSKSIFFAGK